MTKNPKSSESVLKKSQTQYEDFPIVGIGASAGGLEALEKFFENMPHDTEMAFVIVMHFDPTSKSLMTEILKRHTKMEVAQAEEGMKVEPNHVYIIPPNKDMTILSGVLHLLEPVVRKGIRHPINFFFKSLAQEKRDKAICIILSGTGTEGTLGLKDVKREDGMVMVQDVKSAAYDGMPASAIATGLVTYILPPEKMPEQLIKYVNNFYIKDETKPVVISGNTDFIQKIIDLIRDKTGHDFSLYKQNTINRMVEMRMGTHQIDNISDYIRYLQENPAEIEKLYKRLLIGVTKFFRDPLAYDVLKKNIIPEILKNKTTIRVWVPACSTGEEVYSMAIVFKEHLDETKSDIKFQFFATDVDNVAIEFARTGVYPYSIADDVSKERLQRFFTKNPDNYSINKEIRKMVIFSPQNVLKDPPFSKLDMVSCRNLFIYIGPELQQKLLSIFYFSLNKDGILFLGNSETIGQFTDLFTALDRKWKIYRKKSDVSIPLVADIANKAHFEVTQMIKKSDKKQKWIDIGEITENLLLDSYVLSCVIINEECEILYIHGKTGKYLEPSPGKPSLNIVEMAREGLKYELNQAIRNAITQKKEIVYKNLKVNIYGAFQTVNLIVKPISRPEIMKGLMMVIFETVKNPELVSSPRKKYTIKQLNEHVTDLEHELKFTKENLQETIEELQTSNEELNSANEELQSANEELQSANEEMEASREELQSINEELMTLNSEHNDKLEEFSEINNDMKNLLVSTDIATIFLDNDLHIKGYTPAVTRIINLIETDIGRPVRDIVTNLVYENFVRDVKEVIDTQNIKEIELKDKNDLWYFMRILPYRTTEDIIDGVVITFIDITTRRRIEQAERDSKIFADSVIDTIRESLLILDNELRIISANMSFYKTFQVSKDEISNKLIYNIGGHQWDIPELRELLEEIIPRNSKFNDFEVDSDFPHIGPRKMILNARRIYQEREGKEMILLAIEDITDRTLKG